MSFEMDMPDELPKSNFLEIPGTYHVAVTDVDEQPLDGNNAAIEGFRVSFEVLEGTVRHNNVCTEVGKTLDLVFFNPNPSKGESSQKWNRAKQAAFLIAAGLAAEKDLGKKGLKIELPNAKGRQVVLTVEKDQNGKFMQISFANIYAVDDPKVAGIPKDQKALALIGKAPKPGTAAATPAAKTTNGAAASSKPATQQSAPAAAPVAQSAPATAAAATPAGGGWSL